MKKIIAEKVLPFVLGLIFFLCGSLGIKSHIESLSYPTIKAEVKRIMTTKDASGSTSSSKSNKMFYYVYADYNIGGKTFSAASVMPVLFPPKIGSVVNVRYNPENPEEAYVMIGILRLYLITLGALYIMIAVFKKRKNNI